MQYPTLELEEKLWEKGYKYIIGLDEAGRGPWAGPLGIAGILITSPKQRVEKVRDSKTLSQKQKDELYEKVINKSEAFCTRLITPQIIDKVGIAEAVRIGMQDVVSEIEKQIGKRSDFLIIDGSNVREVGRYAQKRINKGDALHYSIAAASILAKLGRDKVMFKAHNKFPEYGFDSHVGYGTKQHKEALEKFGPCSMHRKSYKPIKRLIEESTNEQKKGWRYWRECSG